MVIIRLGDILLLDTDDDFLREATRPDKLRRWMQAEWELQLYHAR
jgi:hypothetical protein